MQMDPATTARQRNGTFLNTLRGAAPPSRAARQHARWGSGTIPLRLHNSPANLVTGVLLLTSLAPGPSLPGPVAAGGRAPQRMQDPSSPVVALLPSAQANAPYRALPVDLPLTGACSPSAVSNGVITACITHPRRCAAALTAGTLAAVGGAAYAGMVAATTALAHAPVPPPYLAGDAPAPHDEVQAAVHQASVLEDDGAVASLEDALLQIARECRDDRSCRARAINELLQHVPSSTLAQLQQIVARTAVPEQEGRQNAWPLPGTAAVPFSAVSQLHELASTLADLYTPAVAAFQDDMETIVGGTRRARAGRDGSPDQIQQRWIAANAYRQQAIAGLLARDVGQVAHLPYTLHGLAHLFIADGTEAFNLHVTVPAAGTTPPTRRVLLVAHSDMIGRALGSEGAYDNASGVATLLHIARQWQRAPSNNGTQLELLVTSHEELGFLGARAYVADCLQQGNCPDFVVNVDMVGRGGHAYAISGTEQLAGSPHLGQPSMYLQAPPVSPIEQRARVQLEQRLAAQGFTHPPAEDAPWMTSDNIAFQNASIPCVGLSQVSGADARQWKQWEDARKTWQRLDAAVDWERWEARQKGAQLPPEEARVLDERYQAAAAAYAVYRRLREQHANAPPNLIHGPRDRLHRVNPAMGVDFADALLDGLRHLQWDAESPAADSASLHH